MASQDQPNLSWQDYSITKKASLANHLESLSQPLDLYARLPYCHQALAYNLTLSPDQRLDRQKRLIEHIDDSAMMSIYPGLIANTRMDEIKKDIASYHRALVFLCKTIANSDLDQSACAALLSAQPAMRSALETSLLHYRNQPGGHKLYRDFESRPLYTEMGVDLMGRQDDLMLAEFQVRYTTPYPHLMTALDAAYRQAMPELLQEFGARAETFEDRRGALLQRAYDDYCTISDTRAQGLVIDAWGYLQNAGGNWKALAERHQMQYSLFDDMHKDQNLLDKKYRKSHVFIFNQPAIHLLEPDHPTFAAINGESLETYDELAWQGLVRKYQDGTAFFCNNPALDIANDKALYSYLPQIVRILEGRDCTLPIVESIPAWQIDDHRQPDREALDMVRNNREDWVITHRYLEGGLGIRLGMSIAQTEWSDFIDTFVTDRPYLYIFRRYFPMQPDLSMRLLLASYASNGNPDADTSDQLEISDSIFARFSSQKPLTSESSRCFSIFAAQKNLDRL